MNAATSTYLETENAETKWESPILANRKNASPRLSLSVKPSKSNGRRGRLVNPFLLKEEQEETSESRDTILAKRREFKALFEAGMNR